MLEKQTKTKQKQNKTNTQRINHKPKIRQNTDLPLNGMHLNSQSTECWTPGRAASSSGTAWVGNAYAKSLAPCKASSRAGYDDTAGPHQTFQGTIYACDTHSCLRYFNSIAIPSFVCPKLACSELLISLHNDRHLFAHYDDVIMTMLASQITSLTVVYSIVYSGVNQRKHQSSASLAFVREIHRGPVNYPHKWPVTRKMFPFDDVIMDGFVTVRTIAMKFGWDKENVSFLKFKKFHLNPTKFNRKLTMMFKLNLKKNHAYRI